MLTRRHLRKKVLEALYGLRQSGNEPDGLKKAEERLLCAIEGIYELYIWQMAMIISLKAAAEEQIERKKAKRFPTFEDLNPNTKFIDNPVFFLLESNKKLINLTDKYNIPWDVVIGHSSRIFKKIEEDEAYVKYMQSSEVSFSSSKRIIVELFEKFIAPDEILIDFYESRSIDYFNDLQVANTMALLTAEGIKEDKGPDFSMPSLYKDDSDKEFTLDLLRISYTNAEQWDALVIEKLENWEPDRVVIIDMLIMEMAISEFIKFPSIPTKVTLNEYIELAKDYSTEKSKVFINGVLDKIVLTLTERGELNKSGRGLM